MSYNNSNYYKGGASGVSRGGRGGSFRSRGTMDVGSGWQNRGRGRGSFSPNSTRGSSTNWYNKPTTTTTNFNKSYNDRNSSGNRDSSLDRFSSRGSESDYLHRYARQGTPDNYSLRNDHLHHRSLEELPRKRMRTDSYSVETNRRGHDGGFDSYDLNRYENFISDKNNYGGAEDRVRPVYRDDRRPSATRREEFSLRPRETSSTTMPPPSQSFRAPTFRGRGVTRGRVAIRGGFTRRQDTFVSPRSRLVESFKAKKRLVMTKPDYFKSKLQKLRSFGTNKVTRKEVRPQDGEDAEEDNWNEETADKDAENGQGKAENLAEKKRPVKIVKKIIKKVVVKKDQKPMEATSAEAESTEKEEGKEEPKEGQEEVEQELEEGEEEGGEEEVGEEEEVVEELEVEEEEEEELDEKDVAIKKEAKMKEIRSLCEDIGNKICDPFTSHRSYIKLQCPHCRTSCLTFRDYHDHLRSSKHIFAMREVSLSMKQTVNRMRAEQRAKQRVIEEAEELQGISSTHTNFCPTCKLNYRQDRERHITSEMHKKMKEHLMPFCTICRISFRSPMLYENHICSLEHIRAKETARKCELEKSSLEEEKDVDMNDLLILDSVGSADESAESEEEADKEGAKEKKEKKHEINLGADYVRKVQVLYCDLCEMYLPRREQLDTALTSHCRTRNHLQRYVRYRDDCHLRKEAERIHRRDKAEQETKTKVFTEGENAEETTTEQPEDAAEDAPASENPEEAKVADTSEDVQEVKKETATATATTPNAKATSAAAANESSDAADSEDKMWADVDKGLDELLREVAPGCKSSDEDEDSGRYDRFKHSKDEAAAEAEAATKKDAEPEKSEPAAE